VEAQSRSFLTSVLDGEGWSKPCPRRSSPGTHFRGGWEGPRTGLDGYGDEQISYPTEVQTPDRPARNKLLYRMHYLASHFDNIQLKFYPVTFPFSFKGAAFQKF
jgi:hypothetical protein